MKREREENKKTERRTERKERAGIERWKEKKTTRGRLPGRHTRIYKLELQKKKSERILLDTLGISRYAFLLGHSPIALSGVMESFVARSAERQTLCARVAHVIAPRLGSAGVQKASKSKT